MILFVLTSFFLFSCKQESNHLITGSTMGTTYSINIYTYLLDSDNLKNRIDSLLYCVNQEMSTYISDSEISTFNKSQKGAYTVSEDFLYVVDKALGYYLLSKKYDITIKPIVDKWGFGDKAVNIIPDSVEINNLLSIVGSDKISIKNNKLIKNDDKVEIDLSSIAKGYAIDKIAIFLQSISYTNFMIEIGGEIKVSGLNNGSKWHLGIMDPTDSKIFKTLLLSNKSLATSGTYNNYFDMKGSRYSHLINPLNGYPVRHNIKSVSVIANNCIDADALATLLIIHDNPYEAINIVDKIESVEAMILIFDEDNHVIEVNSENFNSYID